MSLRNCLEFPHNGIKEIICSKFQEIIGDNKLILFGAGRGGCKVMEFFKCNFPDKVNCISAFADNNPLKQNTYFMDKKVLDPEEAFHEYEGEMVIVCCGEGDEIIEQLKAWGVPEYKIYIPDIAVIQEDDIYYIQNHINLFDVVYSQLADDKSRQVFRNVLNYKLTHEMNFIKKIADSWQDQYFDGGLIKYEKNDILVDCGGYVGDTIESYIKHCHGKYEKIICLEADVDNAKIIEKKISDGIISKVELHTIAAYNEKTKLLFEKLGSGSGRILHADDSWNATALIQADSIDNILSGERCTYIKMDIEGGEYNALLGASSTVRKYKPTLMISVYHKQDDFITLPLLILSLNPDYKLYFRHYRSFSVQETVCYAVNNVK